jgi:hypothetical protein
MRWNACGGPSSGKKRAWSRFPACWTTSDPSVEKNENDTQQARNKNNKVGRGQKRYCSRTRPPL